MEYNEIINLVNDTEQELATEFTEINNTCMFYSEKVLPSSMPSELLPYISKKGFNKIITPYS